MSQRIVKWLAASALLVSANAAMGQVVNTLNWTQPRVVSGAGVESAGPSSIVVVNVPAGLVAAAGLVNANAIIGEVRALSATGTVLDTRAINAAAFVGAPTYNNAAGNAGVQIDFALITGISTTFGQAGLASIQVTLTTTGLVTSANACQTRFNAAATESTENGVADGTQDECAAPDSALPTLASAFLQGTNLFLVFNETMSNGDAANNANHTVLAGLNNTSFQVNTTNAFLATTAVPTGGTFVVQGVFADGVNRVVQVNVTAATDVALGRFIRLAADDNGVFLAANDVFDVVGNAATPGGSVATPVTTGVQITAPPAFTVTRAEWRATYFGGCCNNEFSVVFSTPLLSGGDTNFFNGPSALNLTRGGADSDLNFNCGLSIDPANSNAVLLGICSGGDQVFADGRDFAGSTYAWNYIAGSVGQTPPTDIFGSPLAAPPGSPLTVLDEITPTQQFFTFHDVNRDGRLDAIGIAFNEPVTHNAAPATFTLRRAAGTVQPVQQITALGVLTDDTVVASGTITENVIQITTVALGNIGFFDGFPTRIETNNGILINFNPDTVNWDNDALTAVGGATEAIPGTGGTGGSGACAITIESLTGFTATDAALNATTPAAIAASATTQDRARPDLTFARFFTGDNQDEDNVDFNVQFFGENDGDPGNSINSNRVAFVFSENLASEQNDDQQQQFRFGPGGANGFDNDGFVFNYCLFCGSFVVQNPDNVYTLRNSSENPALIPGVVVSILPQSRVTDPFGNEVLEAADTATVNRIAPYMPLITDVNGDQIFSAFLFDANANGFGDSIRITMNQPIDTATVQVSDFTLSLGTINTVAVQGTDIVLNITDSAVPMTSIITGTYNGGSDTTRIASLAVGGTGVAVSANNFAFDIQRIAPPDEATQSLAFMDIVGTGMLTGTTPFPPGTKIFGMLAVPQIYSVTATHNNVSFSRNAYDDSSSLEAWNRWLFGSQEFVYLGRNTNNYQFYDNDKDLGDDNDAISTYKDVISLTINASNLAAITFTGTGETANDKVTNGKARILWDVLRASSGDIDNVYDFYSGVTPFFGEPIRSSAVVLGNDGRFELHMSAPISGFDGKSRLSGVGRPVILVVELPDGKRFVVSSVTSSVNGAPILFNAQNRNQTTGQAGNATLFNIQLDNVGMAGINTGWNTVPFNRASGYAVNTGAIPVRPNGVTVANVFVPSASSPVQPFTSALHQFVIWGENTEDGMWTRDEDSNMDDFWIDPNVFDLFYFAMTSRGVQMGSAIDGFCGGYALAAFNSCLNYCQYGVFQFGAPLTGNTLFSGVDALTTFPNNATTQGWGLFTSKAAFNPATGIRGTGVTAPNPDLDFIFVFRNNGNQAGSLNRTRIEVSSLDLLAPTGTDNPNDTARIDAGQAFFGHWQP